VSRITVLTPSRNVGVPSGAISHVRAASGNEATRQNPVAASRGGRVVAGVLTTGRLVLGLAELIRTCAACYRPAVQPPECWRGVGEQLSLLHDEPRGRVLGFNVTGFSGFDPECLDEGLVWQAPRFDVPVLGLRSAPIGDVILAARAFFGDRPSMNRILFEAAGNAEGVEAVRRWRICLESGDAMAHFGMGCALYDMGRFTEAYGRLRHSTEIAPHHAWNWCWYGKAAEATGALEEACRAYGRGLELEQSGGEATDARDALERLAGAPGRGGSAMPDVGRRLRIHGCLIGGAIGDALGAPVEFDSVERIRERFGPAGVTDLASAYGSTRRSPTTPR
jgi:hypothetical protein